jgi:hypothetical protein
MKRGRLTLITVMFLAGCSARGEEDWTTSLHTALRDVTRLRVRSGGTCHRELEAEKTLLDLRDAAQIAQCVQGICIDSDESGFACGCCGDPTLEFYKDDAIVVSLGFHHGQSLRWPDGKWSGDGALTRNSAEFLVRWLTDHGVSGPQEEREEQIRLQQESRESNDKWLRAMPECLKPFWSDMQLPFVRKGTQELEAALTKEFPDSNARVLALLTWYGSGEGPWSGYPHYESIAEELLLLNKTESILAAIQDQELTEQQTEGLARLLAGRSFSQQRPNDLRNVPDELKARLLKYSLQSNDEDRRRRAQAAFGASKMEK